MRADCGCPCERDGPARPGEHSRRCRLSYAMNVTWKHLAAALGTVACVHALQMLGPLRLNTDAACFLSMATAQTDGFGFRAVGCGSQYPQGYPATVAALAALGLGQAWALVGLNLACIALGLAACHRVLTRSLGLTSLTSAGCCLLSLLNWSLIKHAPIPLSDLVFFGVSLFCLATMTTAEDRGGWARWRLLAAAVLLCAASMAVRTAGIALVPALLWVTVSQHARRWREARPSPRCMAATIAMGLALGAVLCFLGCYLAQSEYVRSMVQVWRQAGIAKAALFSWHGCFSGSMVTNLQASRMPEWLRPCSRWIGDAGLFAVLAALWLRRRSVRAADIYVLSYIAILCLWQQREPRLWLPVLPLAIAYFATLYARLWPRRGLRVLPAVHAAAYALCGLLALAYSARLTFTGARFPYVYGNGSLTPSYEVALLGAATAGEADPHMVALLRRYDAAHWRRYAPRLGAAARP